MESNTENKAKIPETSKVDNTAGNDSGSENSDTASSSTGSDHDDDWNDWVDEDNQGLPTRSLFEDSVFENRQLALQHDKDNHGFDLVAFCSQLGPQIVSIYRSNFKQSARSRHSSKDPTH